MHNDNLKPDDPVALERLMRFLPHHCHVRLYYLIVGIIEGDVRWCDVLKVHRDTPLRAPSDPVRDDTKVILLHVLDGVFTAHFRRRHAFRVVRRTVLSHAYYRRFPKRLEVLIDKVMLRFANQEHSALHALLPVRISPE